MADPVGYVPRSAGEFFGSLRGKRVSIELVNGTTPAYVGTLMETYADSLVMRLDNQQIVLIYKHAIASLSRIPELPISPDHA
jgi:sRNA-binding regulator protein Hfq